nr:hypothetical protein [Tanacetum cinerariifolium]
MDLFSLIRVLNPTKVKTGSRPRAPNELPLLTLTASRVIEMDEPATATDSSGVPLAIGKSSLDFADEAEAPGQETAAPEVPPPEEVPISTVPGGDPAAAVAVEPPTVQESRKRGHEGIDANASPKSLRRDHADLQPSGVPADVSDPDPLAFANAPSPHPADVIRSSKGVAAAEDPGSKNVSSPTVVGSPGSSIEALLETEADMKRAAEEKSAGLKDDTGDDAPLFIRDLRPSSSQLAIPVYPEVRDPWNPWACTEEIKLANAIAANISRAE